MQCKHEQPRLNQHMDYKVGTQLMLNDLCGRTLAQVELLLALRGLPVQPKFRAYLYRKDETSALNVMMNLETTLLVISYFTEQRNFIGGFLYRLPHIKEGILENLGRLVNLMDIDELDQAEFQLLDHVITCFVSGKFIPVYPELSEKIMSRESRDWLIKDYLENRQQDALQFVYKAQQLAIDLEQQMKDKQDRITADQLLNISETPLVDTSQLGDVRRTN